MALVDVHFQWSDEKGKCYECGLPAAYEAPNIYGLPSTGPREERLLCSVCAAMHAAEGERIVWLFAEEFR